MAHGLLAATERWITEAAGSIAAVIAFDGLAGASEAPEFAAAKRELEARVRERWAGKTRADLRAEPVLAAYDRYYRRFGQTYHVQQQLESIALKGKAIPSRSPLVEALFMTELATGVLAAGQDLAEMTLPVTVDIAAGDERSTRYDGVEEALKAGDQYMRDAGGSILTSIIQGPTTHARLTGETTAAIYCLYGPPGVSRETMDEAIEATARFVRLCAPGMVERGRMVHKAR